MERSKRIVVIRIKGVVKTPSEIKDTLHLLRLRRTNVAVVLDDRPSFIGMVKKIEPWVAWGEISPEVFKKLLLKRGRLEGDKRVTEEYIKQTTGMDIDTFVEKFFRFEVELTDIPRLKPFFRLKPPSGGYPRKGIKVQVTQGGTWGYWGDRINKLLETMI
ncbi:MAG TPA: 50S ribosomal protein L30 [Candidatus Nanopusillus sp.]|nr:50S ribosomal protein L30 [Candidatus Nanopusillus sp.]